MAVFEPRLRVLALVLCIVSLVVGVQVQTQPDSHARGEYDSFGLEKRAAPSFYARIMPLGASIVWGYNTPDGNGFRKPLYDDLTGNGWKVDMVGSKQHGTMNDNNVEAHPGDVIDQVAQAALNSIKYQPNIVVINAGNNDCHRNLNISFAGYRMGKLLDELYDKIPGVTIVLSTLILSTNSDVEETRGSVNSQMRTLVNDRLKSQNKIVLAEMTGDGSGFVQQADLTSDGIHPNANGAKKMGQVFYQAIVQANDNGLLTAPPKTDFSSGENQAAQVAQSSSSPSATTTATPTSFGAVLQTKQASGTASANSSMLTPVSPNPATPTGSPQASSTNILSDGQGAHPSAAGSLPSGRFGFFSLAASLTSLFLWYFLL